jgi:hypothetical protein
MKMADCAFKITGQEMVSKHANENISLLHAFQFYICTIKDYYISTVYLVQKFKGYAIYNTLKIYR